MAQTDASNFPLEFLKKKTGFPKNFRFLQLQQRPLSRKSFFDNSYQGHFKKL